MLKALSDFSRHFAWTKKVINTTWETVVTSNILELGNWWPVVFSVVPWGILNSTLLPKSCLALNSASHLFVFIMADMSSSQLYIKDNQESSLVLLWISQGFFILFMKIHKFVCCNSQKVLDFKCFSFCKNELDKP